MRRDNRNLICLDTLLLMTPLIAGTLLYGTICVAEIGIKSFRTFVWGKK